MKKNKNNDNIAKLIIIYIVCFLFISTAYSFFSTDLELKGKATIVVNEEKLYETEYEKTGGWNQGSVYYYQYTVTVKYLGEEPVTGWNVNIGVPIDTELSGCYSAGTCTIENNILKIPNAAWNGNLSPNNQTVSVSFIMATSVPDYEVDVLSVNFFKNGEIINPTDPIEPDPGPGENPDPEEPDPGPGENPDPDKPDPGPGEDPDPDKPDPGEDPDPIDPIEPPKVEPVKGFSVDLKTSNYWGTTTQFSVDITNDSTISLSTWKLQIKVPPGSKISTLWGGDYIITDDLLTITPLSWNASLAAGATSASIGFQLTSSTAPAKLQIYSLSGVDNNQESVEMEI